MGPEVYGAFMGGYVAVTRVTETTPIGHFSEIGRVSTMFSLRAYASLTCISRDPTRG